MTDRFDVVIIGAGHNALVCAGYLARAGLEVVCLESRDRSGGMSGARTLGDGYHFPGLSHVAFPVDRAIRRDLELDRFGYAAGAGVETISLGVERGHLRIGEASVDGDGLPERDRRAYPQFRRDYQRFTKALQPLFENPPPRLKSMSRHDRRSVAKLGWNVRIGLGRERMYEFLRVAGNNIQDVLDETFVDDRLKGAIAADAVLGSAMGPRTPGTVLTWLQRIHGSLNGGMVIQGCGRGGLTESLVQSAQAAGVTLRCGSPVERINTENGRATGVSLSTGETVPGRLVISGADARSTFLDLAGPAKLDAMFANRVRQIRGRGTVGKLHLALAGEPRFNGIDQSLLGNRIVLAPSVDFVEHAFNHSKYGESSDHPVLEITIPSLHEAGLAPAGHHVMSVNVAFLPWRTRAEEGDEYRHELEQRIIYCLEQHAPGLGSLIVDRELLTPGDVEREYGAVQGHWHHGELSMHQSFMMRPVHGAAQYETPIDGLYLCGAGTHPGGGVTGMPGRNAARRVLAGEAGA